MIDPNQFRRRAHLLAAGEQLLLSRDPIEAAIRFSEFATYTGIPGEDLVVSPLCALPLPRYPKQEPGLRRWAGTNPQAMWHPLLWLPPRLAHRATVTTVDGQEVPEPDDIWVVRLVLELVASGLYDQDTGTWLDVLSTVGIDIDHPGSVERVRWWLDGGVDPVLDNLDLTPLVVDEEDPDWALDSALSMRDGLLDAAMALGADSLIATLDDVADYRRTGMTPEVAVSTVIRVAGMSEVFFYSLPERDDTAPVEEVEFAQWIVRRMQEMRQSGAGIEDLLAGPVVDLSDRLVEVRERFWPRLEGLIAEFETANARAVNGQTSNGLGKSPGGGNGPVDWATWDSFRR